MRGPRGFGDLQVREICNKNDGICLSDDPITNLVCFANGVAGYFLGDHAYDINPNAVSGGGDTIINQPPRIPGCGPPLPLPGPTLYERFNGNLPAAQNAVRGVRMMLLPMLPADIRNRLAEFPWLSVPA